jgi:hypothetical protein
VFDDVSGVLFLLPGRLLAILLVLECKAETVGLSTIERVGEGTGGGKRADKTSLILIGKLASWLMRSLRKGDNRKCSYKY